MTKREIAEAHRYAEMIREKDKARIQQEQPEPSNNLVDVDAVREDFITEVYRVLDADPTNDRANAIIDAFDSLPTVSQEQPEDVVVVARAFLDVLSKTPYNNKPITDAQAIIRQLLLFFENPKEYNPDAIVEQPEVDLEKEIDAVWNPRFNLGWDENSCLTMNRAGFEKFSRHFYELGLKARKV